jgi:FlaA1/EpsC-like NDP-sugar epimerase
MITERLRFYSWLNQVGDIFLLIFSFILACILIWGSHFRPDFPIYFIKVLVAVVLCWGVTALLLKLYAPGRYKQYGRSLAKHFQAIAFFAVLLAVVVFLYKDFQITRVLFIDAFLLFVFLDTLLRLCFIYLLRRR